MDNMLQHTFREIHVPICTVAMLRLELYNTMEHGLIKHRGDWYHEWARNQRGTLSYIWHY